MLPEPASASAPKGPAKSVAGGPNAVAAAASTKPVWRSLPLSSQGSVVAAAATSSRAGPVYRSLAVAQPRSDAGFGHLDGLQKPGLVRGVAYAPPKPALKKASTEKGDLLFHVAPTKQKSASLAENFEGLKVVEGSLLTNANPVPIIFHRSAKHFEIGKGVSVSEISDMLAAVAKSQGARIKANARKGSVKFTKLAPPSAPDGGCSDCVCKVHVYRQQDGSHLCDWTHREGSRTVAADLYRHVLARMKDSITGGPQVEQLLVGGAPRPCRVYSVPALPRTSSPTAAAGASAAPAPAEPAVAAAAVEPLLASAASPCVDQQLAACQLLARLTAAGREDYMAASIVGALYDAKARGAVVSLFGCLAPAAAKSAEPGLREDVRRCIVSTVANMALQQQDAAALRALLSEAKALGAVRDALPGGAKEVDPATFASDAARDALKLACGDE